MTKSERIAAMVQPRHEGTGHDPHYAAYFERFNRQEFYEAHDVLEHIWLPIRKTPEGAFYKGLIQLAGAFVHLQKNRLGPAAAIFKLSRHNLEPFAPAHRGLDVAAILQLIAAWVTNGEAKPLTSENAPQLRPPDPSV